MHNEDRTIKDKQNGVLITVYSKRSEKWNAYKTKAQQQEKLET